VDRAKAFYAEQAGFNLRGVDVSEIRVLGRPGRPGFRFASFRDPDRNGWALQEERPFEPGSGSRQ
jgi:hypothetical protein